MPAYAKPRRKPTTEGQRHPFYRWICDIHAAGELTIHRGATTDLLLGDWPMKYLALGAERGRIALLGGNRADMQAITSVQWTSAALVRGHAGRDWIALAVKDARIRGAEEMNALGLRLWLPIPAVKMDAYLASKPNRLRLRIIDADAKTQMPIPPSTSEPPLLDVPLALKGQWVPGKD